MCVHEICVSCPQKRNTFCYRKGNLVFFKNDIGIFLQKICFFLVETAVSSRLVIRKFLNSFIKAIQDAAFTFSQHSYGLIPLSRNFSGTG